MMRAHIRALRAEAAAIAEQAKDARNDVNPVGDVFPAGIKMGVSLMLFGLAAAKFRAADALEAEDKAMTDKLTIGEG